MTWTVKPMLRALCSMYRPVKPAPTMSMSMGFVTALGGWFVCDVAEVESVIFELDMATLM